MTPPDQAVGVQSEVRLKTKTRDETNKGPVSLVICLSLSIAFRGNVKPNLRRTVARGGWHSGPAIALQVTGSHFTR